MRIASVTPQDNHTLLVTTEDGQKGTFDVTPYLEYEAFSELKEPDSFKEVSHGGYYVEWACGADLSADTIEAHLKNISH